MIKNIPFTNFDLKTIENGDAELIEIKEGWTTGRKIPNIPHRHIFHEIIWLTKGGDYHLVDHEVYSLTNNEILFIPKNSIHDYRPGTEARGWKLIFEESFFTSSQLSIIKDSLIFIPCLGNKAFQMEKEESEIVNSIFVLLNSITGRKQKQTLIINLLTFVEDCYLSKLEMPDSLFVNFLKLLNDHLYEHKDILYYAEQLKVTDKTLNTVAKQATGKTVLDYIHARLLFEAKSKLLNKDVYIKEIADSLGYNDALYFSRFFKKKCGLSPLQYRKQFS